MARLVHVMTMLKSASSDLRHPQVPIPRACGAITLLDVLARYGIQSSITEIWPNVSAADPFGTSCAKSNRLAWQANQYGLEAAVIQCQRPHAWNAIQHCFDQQLSIILNHQAPQARNEGHYSQLLSINDDHLQILDPITRATLQFNRADFLDHWEPNREISGFVLIAMDEKESFHRTPGSMICPRCEAKIRFIPSGLFRLSDWRQNGLWNRFFCPQCDAGFSTAS